MNWSLEATLSLLEAYKNEPVLWDRRDVSHTNKRKRQEAYNRLAKPFSSSVHTIEKKIHSLRTQFNREHKRVQQSNGTYLPKWFGYKHMLFLTEGPHSDIQQTKYEYARSAMDFIKTEMTDEDEEELDQTTNEGSSRHMPNQGITSAIPDKPSNSHNICSRERDELTVFGEYVANSLRAMQQPYFRTQAKHRINLVIYQTEMDIYRYGQYETSEYSGTFQQGPMHPILNNRPAVSERLSSGKHLSGGKILENGARDYQQRY